MDKNEVEMSAVHVQEVAITGSLSASSVLLSLSLAAQPCYAEEVAAAIPSETNSVVPAASSGLPLGLEPSEIVLLLTPLIGYGIYKFIVIPKNPKATFNDLLLIQAGFFIFANIVGIVFFKTRLY
ncbi:hypothetical protein CEUSTIGMA_g8331.t1 [Chlamydomonas eustigma]|uniref:Uncharacterized protein n=1 Tax=Chlamydomonas eustigma TaxID=1157962 RepID=A0A250XCX5_9CHLO|nr:hypothetical protein CEUSTIGMA_g8331.t1 [Chlamydomonas eustigma]|eukprot:GAX80896.1 hypothetical protein CEUSTIGMA_g8331.t1 [Chlamydomonas eustigma]